MAIPALLGMIAGPAIKALLGDAFGSVERIANAYINKQISKEQFDAELRQVGLKTIGDIEVAQADAAARIYETGQETVRASFTAPSWWTRNVWAFVATSQVLVLLWYQIGIPFYVWFGELPRSGTGALPRTGDTLLEWAYFLVAACIGVGAWQMSRGATTMDKVKDIVNRR